MSDLGLSVLALIVLIIIGRLAFKDARQADEEESKLDNDASRKAEELWP